MFFVNKIFVVLLVVSTRDAVAQQRIAIPPEALQATIAAAVHLFFEADSLPSVGWASPKTLLRLRPGTVVFSGISIRLREGTAQAAELTRAMVDTLNQRGLPSRAAPRASASNCTRSGRGSITRCTLHDDVALHVLVGFPGFN